LFVGEVSVGTPVTAAVVNINGVDHTLVSAPFLALTRQRYGVPFARRTPLIACERLAIPDILKTGLPNPADVETWTLYVAAPVTALQLSTNPDTDSF
jgi:hypothetical protein